MGRSSLETGSNVEADGVGLETEGVLASRVYVSNGRFNRDVSSIRNR